MAAEFDIEKRARELLFGDHATIAMDKFGDHFIAKAIQLAREAADAREKELANSGAWLDVLKRAERAAADARAEEIARTFDEHHRKKSYVCDVPSTWFYAASIARSTIAPSEVKADRDEIHNDPWRQPFRIEVPAETATEVARREEMNREIEKQQRARAAGVEALIEAALRVVPAWKIQIVEDRSNLNLTSWYVRERAIPDARSAREQRLEAALRAVRREFIGDPDLVSMVERALEGS